MNIAVLGAGAWGTAMAISLAQRHAITLWARDPAQCAAMRADRVNQKYLPGFRFPDSLQIAETLEPLAGADLALLAMSTAGLRETLRKAKTAGPHVPVIWLCKGFEPGRAQLPHQVVDQEIGATGSSGVLSGPSFAEEVARGLPAAVTLASANAEFARHAARALHGPAFRVYSSDDLVGVEVA